MCVCQNSNNLCVCKNSNNLCVCQNSDNLCVCQNSNNLCVCQNSNDLCVCQNSNNLCVCQNSNNLCVCQNSNNLCVCVKILITYVCQNSVFILKLKKVIILIVSTKFTHVRNRKYIFRETIYLTASFVIFKLFLIFSDFYFPYPNFLKTLWKYGCVFNGFLRVLEILKSRLLF